MDRFRNILLVLDERDVSRKAVDRAVALASSNQASLTILEAWPELPGYLPRRSASLLRQLRKDKRQAQLADIQNAVSREVGVRTALVKGTPYVSIIEAVLANGHDLVLKVVGGDPAHAGLSGTDMHLLRKCPCPVWLMRAGEKSTYENILATVDFDLEPGETAHRGLNDEILGLASSLAVSEFCALHVLHVWSAYGESMLRGGLARADQSDVDEYVADERAKRARLLDEALARNRRSIGADAAEFLQPKTYLRKGEPARVVPRVVKEISADLLVMGTVARIGLPGFIIGNTAETILRDVGCAVLAVKPEGFESPVGKP